MSDELDRRAAEIARLRDELDAARAECERLRAELEELQHSHHELVTDMAREIDQLRVRPSTPWPHTWTERDVTEGGTRDYGERKAGSVRPAMTPDTRADRDTIRAAAAAVRSTAIADQYAGTRGHPAAAFSMAAVLDELALHAASLPEDLRRAVVAACWEIIKGEGWQDRRS